MATQCFDDLPAKQRRRLVLQAVLRTLVTVGAVVAIYFLIPMDRPMDAATVIGLALGVAALVVIVAWQILRITRSDRPGVLAVETLAFSLPVFVLLFATTYFLMERASPATFTQPLSRIDSMYFSATVFTTVGFGDITAKSQTARVLVTAQMMPDLVVLGVVARFIINAIKVGQQRQAT